MQKAALLELFQFTVGQRNEARGNSYMFVLALVPKVFTSKRKISTLHYIGQYTFYTGFAYLVCIHVKLTIWNSQLMTSATRIHSAKVRMFYQHFFHLSTNHWR